MDQILPPQSKPSNKIEADIPIECEREIMLNIMVEYAIEDEEDEEWCHDQIIEEMAREAVEQEELQKRCK